MKTCVSCRWWSVPADQAAVPGSRVIGFCKRHPPAVVRASADGLQHAQALPETLGSDWCGEHTDMEPEG